MLGLKGAYIVIGEREPFPVVLGERAAALFTDRCLVVGAEKACAYTFGEGYFVAVPCHVEAMESMAFGYEGPHKVQVRAMCACVRLGKPFQNGSDGGDKVRQGRTPRKPNPSGAMLPADAIAGAV